MVDVETPIEAQRRMERERLAKLDISEEEMREEFERHFGAPVPLARHINGDYVYAEARVAFNNYCAGIKLMQERCK